MTIFIFLLLLFSHCGFSVNVEGGLPLSVRIGKVETVLTLADISTMTENQILKIEDRDFSLSATWAIFSLKEGKEYNLTTWELGGSCGCSNQICGKDCPGIKGEDCDANTFEEPATCLISTRKGFCWGFVGTGTTQNYTLYNISQVAAVALMSYGGPQVPFVGPGFTIRTQLKDERYALNAMITGFKPRREVPLSNYRYAESEGRLLTVEQFTHLTSKPSLSSTIVHTERSICPQVGFPRFETTKIIQNLKEDEKVNIRSYLILRKGNLDNFSSLLNRYILTPTGLSRWSTQLTFDIFDPCNQQFLTLQIDRMGNFFVFLPNIQSLMKEEIICVAVNDVSSNPYDLALYELKNATNIWRNSDRFRGLLSADYLESLELRITSKSSQPLNLLNAKVEIEFNLQGDIPVLKLLTSTPLDCEIFLSPNCVIRLTTTQEQFIATKPIEPTCNHWYEVGKYMCQGVSGNFYPPSKCVETPISGYTENTTAISAFSIETTSNAPQTSFEESFYEQGWRTSTLFEKFVWICTGVMMFLIIALVCYISWRAPKKEIAVSIKTKEETEMLLQRRNTQEEEDEVSTSRAGHKKEKEEREDKEENPIAAFARKRRERDAFYAYMHQKELERIEAEKQENLRKKPIDKKKN